MRLIDADKLCRELATVDERYESEVDWFIRILNAEPTVDAVSREKYEAREETRKILVEFADDLLAELKERVEVVRCKDCIDWDKDGFCGITGREEPESHYCSYGERKNEE